MPWGGKNRWVCEPVLKRWVGGGGPTTQNGKGPCWGGSTPLSSRGCIKNRKGWRGGGGDLQGWKGGGGDTHGGAYPFLIEELPTHQQGIKKNLTYK